VWSSERERERERALRRSIIEKLTAERINREADRSKMYVLVQELYNR
jgi:hypothetical protein